MNLIVVGDSFCSSAEGWPSALADRLGLNLICHGIGGQPWWNAREFLIGLPDQNIEQAEHLVFVHTNAERIPTNDIQIGMVDHSNLTLADIDQAVKLYYKYIHNHEFLIWAQQQWFFEISQRWGHKKITHLHAFPWSLHRNNLPVGLNVITNLCSISFNEIAADQFTLINDQRPNHLNYHNNQELARQLAHHLNQHTNTSVELDSTLFDLKTTKWFDWN
jgi:hypothetical protein